MIQQVKLVSISSFSLGGGHMQTLQATRDTGGQLPSIRGENSFPLPFKTHMKREEEKKRRPKEAREAVEKIGKRRVLGHSWLAAKVFGQVQE